MGAESAQRLRERFEREGFVELRLHPWKAATHVVVVLAIAVAILLVVWFGPPLFVVLAGVLLVWYVVAVGALYAEQLLGAGPPLRADRDGLTVRRFHQPLHLRWEEVDAVVDFRANPLGAPLVGIHLSPWVWHDYRASRTGVLRWVDVLTHYSSHTLVLLKVLDSPATDVIALLDGPTIDRMLTIRPPYRLVLALTGDGGDPVHLRGGHPAHLSDLPLGEDLAHAVSDWNQRAVSMLQREPDPDAAGLVTAAATEEGRALAARVQEALGPDARVLVAADVPIWTWRGSSTVAGG